jgi:hypothetical protein
VPERKQCLLQDRILGSTPVHTPRHREIEQFSGKEYG